MMRESNSQPDQHNLIKDLFEEVLSASTDEAREKAFTELRQLLAVRTAEEMVMHPRARREINDSDAIVDARLKEGHEAKDSCRGWRAWTSAPREVSF